MAALVGCLAGLQGCGINSGSAPVGTAWELPFVVFDTHMPAAQASLTKTISLISPCPSFKDIHCPGAAAPCGPTPCDLRDPAPAAEADIPPPEIYVNTSLLVPGVDLIFSGDGENRTLTVLAPCSREGALPLPACVDDASTEPSRTSSAPGMQCAIVVRTGVTLYEPPRLVATSFGCESPTTTSGACSECSTAALLAGDCVPSLAPYAFELRANDRRGLAAQPLAVEVSMWNLSSVADLAYRVTLASRFADDNAAITEFAARLEGHAASSTLARALLIAYWQGVWEVPACEGIADRVLLHAEVAAASPAAGGEAALAVQMRVSLGLRGNATGEPTALCLSQLGLLHGDAGLYAAWELLEEEETLSAVVGMALDSSSVQQAQCATLSPEEAQVSLLTMRLDRVNELAREAELMLVRLLLPYVEYAGMPRRQLVAAWQEVA